jgi:hypothetical protein
MTVFFLKSNYLDLLALVLTILTGGGFGIEGYGCYGYFTIGGF